METLIGFAIGYWAGTRDGAEGLAKAMAAIDAITKSEEFKSLLGTGMAMGGSMMSKGLQSTGGNSLAQGVLGAVAGRAGKLLGGGLRAA